jgi:hypothetical protein
MTIVSTLTFKLAMKKRMEALGVIRTREVIRDLAPQFLGVLFIIGTTYYDVRILVTLLYNVMNIVSPGALVYQLFYLIP